MAKRPEVTRDSAEMLAIQVLNFLAEDPERLSRFLAFSGIEAQSLRDAAREPNFLLGVLDHLAGDERLLTDFVAKSELTPEVVIRARDLLAGAPPATP
jgi:hypothetical protein